MTKLLIIIDLQKGWRHKTATEDAMLRTVELCQQFKGDIIHCCFKNDLSSLFYEHLNWSRFSEPADTDQIPEVVPLKLPLYWRHTYSCLNEETWPLIKRYDQVYIAGVFTDISVSATAMAVFDKNIPVAVVKDCVATLHGETVHHSALRSLEYAIGDQNLVLAKTIIKAS